MATGTDSQFDYGAFRAMLRQRYGISPCEAGLGPASQELAGAATADDAILSVERLYPLSLIGDFSTGLLRQYGISAWDAGMDIRDAARWLDGFESAQEAVLAYAEKHDLDPINDTGFGPSFCDGTDGSELSL